MLEIYHYLDAKDKWVPFTLTAEQGRKWNKFCQELMIKRPDEPNPYRDDYRDFMDSLKE